MKRELKITLGLNGAVGTKVEMRTTRWFHKPTNHTYVCTKQDILFGASWVCLNGPDPDEDEIHFLNMSCRQEVSRQVALIVMSV